MADRKPNKPVVFFDEPCLLCQKSVQWIIRNERLGNSLFFSPLQGKMAQTHLPKELRTPPLQGVVFLDENGQVFEGAAAIRAFSPRLKNPWRICARFMPRWGYKLVASRRHMLFEKREESCLVGPAIRQRILD
jgi:predicted DCC family thiol-disulfide oxidoreductase YuxK